jgi:hypothetical protein
MKRRQFHARPLFQRVKRAKHGNLLMSCSPAPPLHPHPSNDPNFAHDFPFHLLLYSHSSHLFSSRFNPLQSFLTSVFITLQSSTVIIYICFSRFNPLQSFLTSVFITLKSSKVIIYIWFSRFNPLQPSLTSVFNASILYSHSLHLFPSRFNPLQLFLTSVFITLQRVTWRHPDVLSKSSTPNVMRNHRQSSSTGLKISLCVTRLVGRQETEGQQQVLLSVVRIWLFSGATTWKQKCGV